MINNLSRKKILIIGASGQIGIELLNQLKDLDCQITAIRNSKWDKTNVSNISYINFDLCSVSNDKLKNIIHNHDYIFHLAGNTSVTCKKEEEFDYYLGWIKPLQKILEFMVDTDKVLVFASSASVYGVNPELPITELTYENPQTAYDLAKLGCDNLIKYYKDFYKVRCVSLRFSNVYGPMTSSGQNSRRALNKIVDIIHEKKKITLVGDGSYSRNYIHVYDAAAMIIYSGNNILETTSILLACSNENMMFKEVIGELVNAYEKKFMTKIKITFGLPSNFITDERSFSAKPSNFFINNFKFKYDIKKGFEEIINLQ
jgi:UDP-glucose 4-epimerase